MGDHLLSQQAHGVHHLVIGQLPARIDVQRHAGDPQCLLILVEAVHNGFRGAIGDSLQDRVIACLREPPEPFERFLIARVVQRLAYQTPLSHGAGLRL